MEPYGAMTREDLQNLCILINYLLDYSLKWKELDNRRDNKTV